VGHRPAFLFAVSDLRAFLRPVAGMRGMIQVQDRVARLVEGPLEEMGYELVRVSLSGGNRAVLQIMAERADGAVMTVHDCTDISHTVSLLLDEEDPIAGAYALEVSSPGIDRPLTRPKDFERYAGFEVRLETRQPVGGRKRFRGRLKGLNDGAVSVQTDEGEVLVELDAIAKAQLVLTDELIKAATVARQDS
jgi:ribosome maturation factor RimP